MYMTLDEVRRKLNKIITYPEVKKDTLVANAIVVQQNDKELVKQFCPGTVLFNCIDSMNDTEWYQLSITPDRSSKWLN